MEKKLLFHFLLLGYLINNLKLVFNINTPKIFLNKKYDTRRTIKQIKCKI